MKPLTLRHTWRPWTSFRLGWAFSSVGVCSRRKSRIAARIALPVIILSGMTELSYAQSTWEGTTSDWNTATNWTPTEVPTGTATFGAPGVKSITFSQDTTVGALQFDAPNYMFALSSPPAPPEGATIAITGVGIQVANPANSPTFNVSFPQLEFTNSSTAGTALSTHSVQVL